MTKRKICVVLTARASYAKIKSILVAIKDHPALELQLICAGGALLRRFGEVDRLIAADGFSIDERINMVVEGDNLLTSSKTTGLGIIEFSSAYARLNPDCVLIMADRYEQMAAAIPAAYMNIPIAHVQGGEVSGNIDEKVRHSITKLADIHFPATQRARDWIISMGEDAGSVFLSGCPSTDICQQALEDPNPFLDVYEKYGGVGDEPDLFNNFLIVMQHPVTTEIGNAADQINMTLRAIVELEIPTLWFWPNIDPGSDDIAKEIRSFREEQDLKNVHFFINMAPFDFLKLLSKASAIIGNSSCGIRESSYLGVPSINIGSRQMDRERGTNVIDVDYDFEKIKEAIEKIVDAERPIPSALYGTGRCGKIIANTLATTQLTYKKRLNYLND